MLCRNILYASAYDLNAVDSASLVSNEFLASMSFTILFFIWSWIVGVINMDLLCGFRYSIISYKLLNFDKWGTGLQTLIFGGLDSGEKISSGLNRVFVLLLWLYSTYVVSISWSFLERYFHCHHFCFLVNVVLYSLCVCLSLCWSKIVAAVTDKCFCQESDIFVNYSLHIPSGCRQVWHAFIYT